jgi:hypothetical protein
MQIHYASGFGTGVYAAISTVATDFNGYNLGMHIAARVNCELSFYNAKRVSIKLLCG